MMKITVQFLSAKKNRIINDVDQVFVGEGVVSFMVSDELKLYRFVLANIIGWVVEG